MKIKLPQFSPQAPLRIFFFALVVTASAAMAASSPASDAALEQQVTQLQAKTKQLEAALAAKGPSPAASPMPGMSMPAPAMPGMTASNGPAAMPMGGMPMNPQDAKPMPAAVGMSGMMTGMMGMMNQMMGMGAMPSASPGMAMSPPAGPQSALPGFPGVSHLYHIGSTGFFLEHAQHIGLSMDQQAALTKIKDQALAAKTGTDRQIEQAEQEMAALTSADQPDAAKIEAKVRVIEKLRTDERLSFIRAVGEAAKLLTDDQRKVLTGAMQTPAPSPSASMAPMPHM